MRILNYNFEHILSGIARKSKAAKVAGVSVILLSCSTVAFSQEKLQRAFFGENNGVQEANRGLVSKPESSQANSQVSPAQGIADQAPIDVLHADTASVADSTNVVMSVDSNTAIRSDKQNSETVVKINGEEVQVIPNQGTQHFELDNGSEVRVRVRSKGASYSSSSIVVSLDDQTNPEGGENIMK